MVFDWHFAWTILPELLRAFVVSLEATGVGFLLALGLGLVMAISQRSRRRIIAWPIHGFVEFVRYTPLLVQLYFLFYVLPVYRITLTPFEAGVVGLGLQYGTYVSEVYRAGIESVVRGQWEAAITLGLSRYRTWVDIVLPQAVPPVIPGLGNYLIILFKDTSILSAITVVELLEKAEIIGSTTFRYLEPLTMVGAIYFAVSYPASVAVRRLEARVALNYRKS